VLVPEDGGGAGRVAVIVLFVLVLAGTGITDTLFPASVPRRPPPELQRLLSATEDASVWDGSWARRFEVEQRLRSRVRSSVAKPYASALFTAFGELSPSTLVGDGQWLFDRERALPPDSSDEQIAGFAASVLAAVQARVESLGLACAFLPVPRKAVVCRAHLPPGVDPRPELDRLLMRALREHGVHAADVLSALETASNELLFFPCDTHWTPAAHRIAVEETLRAAGWWVEEAQRATELREATVPTPQGNFDLLLRDDVELGPALYEALRNQGATRISVVKKGGRRNEVVAGLEVDLAAGRLALCGTSFSDNRSVPSLVAHFAQTSVLRNVISAAEFMEPLRVFLERRRTPEVERVLVEFPVHQVFFRRERGGAFILPRPVGELFARFAPAATRPIDLGPRPGLEERFAGERPAVLARGERVLVTSLPPLAGRLEEGARPCLEVRGRLESGSLELVLESVECVLAAPWPAGATRVVLPILDRDPVATGVRLLVRATEDARLVLEDVRFVLE